MSKRESPSAAEEIRIHLKETIQNRFFLILVALFAAIFLVQTVIYFARYRDERNREMIANLELARAVAKRFESFVHDVLHQELVIGIAIIQNASQELIDSLLVESEKEYGAASGFAWAQPNGKIAYAGLPGFVGTDIGDREYFKKILNGAEWSVSNLLFFGTTGRMIFTINRGFLDDNGDLLGVMVTGIYADHMENILGIDRTGKGMLNLLDRNGVAVFEYPGYSSLLEKGPLIEEFPMIKKAFEGQEVMTTLENFNGSTDMVTAFAPVSSFGWIALAGRPHEEIVGPIFLDLLSHGMLFGFLVLPAFAAAVFFSRKLTDPLTRLQPHATALGKEEQVDDRTRELQDFAFVASHDLQEPLRKIQAFGDLLRSQYEAELGEEGRDYLGRMQGAAIRMRTLIDALLSYSLVTTKGEPFSPVDLEEMVQEALSNLEMRIHETGAAVEWKDLPVIEADPAQMMQLFQNLIGNGLKFNESKPPEIQIEGRNVKKKLLCEIRVADNGIGFDEKYIDRIFSPFQRLHGRSEYEGTGMGLAICRKIIERHNGTITAQRGPDHGAIFIIQLPKKQKSGLSAPMKSLAGGNGQDRPYSNQKEKK